MKKFLPFLASLLLASVSWGQTGNGVVLLTDASYTFTPTTVDSSATFNMSLKNDVGIAQTMFFGGLDAPFQLSSDAPIEVASGDTIDFSITFTPSAIGSFSDTLEVIGNVFGSASLVVSGDGIQVQLEWTPDTLAFDTTAIGQTNSQTLALSSVGDGAAVISSIDFSNDIFSVDSALSSFNIAEGTSENIVVNYAPVNAGAVEATMTLHTNDPTNATIEIALTAVGISEVIGEICDITWTLINSPYTLVGDVVVPEGCTLNIDPGVEVIGNDYDIEVFGEFFANGEEGNEIQIEVGELISQTDADNMILTSSNILETASSEFTSSWNSLVTFLDTTRGPTALSLYPNENSLNHFGKFSENFGDSNAQGWSAGGSNNSTGAQNGYYQVYGQGSNSGSYYTSYIFSPTFDLFPGELPTNVSFRVEADLYAPSNSRDMKFYVQYDENEWEQMGSTLSNFNENQWYDRSFSLNAPPNAQTVRFRFSYYYRYYSSNRIDDFILTTNLYPGQDIQVPTTLAEKVNFLQDQLSSTVGMGTGGIRLESSSFTGDLHSIGDSISMSFENSVVVRNSSRSKASHGICVYGNNTHINAVNSNVLDHQLNGIRLFSSSNILLDDLNTSVSNNDGQGIMLTSQDIQWNSAESTMTNNGKSGVIVRGNREFNATELEVNGNGVHGLDLGANSNLSLFGARIQGNEGRAIGALAGSVIDLDYVLMDDNGGRGIDLAASGALSLGNCRLQGNGTEGIHSGSPVSVNHCNIAFSGGTGLVLTGNNFHTLNNSILWGNNSSNYTQIDIGGGVISTSYSTVQGRSSYGTTGSGQYYWGEGVIEADPLFADNDLHLEIFSPCVDGGQPWHQDAYMPFGLGGVRADMGMYGGPDNAYWGGEALPDGASALTSVSDSPQDQGGVVGLVFDASFYDNSDLVNNVTSYAFWRHYDPTGQSIGTLDEGNWELIGEMPAQSFNGYAYQAQTLGNTNAFGTFNSCYTVVAQTDDPDTYWYSNVLCGESVDNLAPVEPELEGMVLETGGVTVFWELPSEEDYAYTKVTSDAGFTAEVTGDTLAVDLSAELGGTYTYTAVHYDVNGNASDPASLTLALEPGFDVITLNAGWNLISTDRAVTQGVDEVFAGLAAGNLQYVTGFDGGVQFYDPNGLSFLNTLGSLTPGNGYWVKVAADDVLEVSGVRLAEDFMPGLEEGWNLVGYAAETPAAPGDVYADLLAEGDLLYVTGFDEGVEVYDPSGLPFLNTLTEMRNGFGYWVKSAVATDGDVLAPLAGDVLPAEMPTPRYDVVNGVSELGAYAGEFVEVVNRWGTTVARLPILEGGHLMTTALFGDDPATGAVEGLADGEELHFAFRGAMANETLVFGGDMAHKTLTLTFDEVGAAMGVFPNPASDAATFRFQLDMDAQVELTLVDLAGRQVAVLLDANKGAGTHAETLALPAIPAGAYTVQLRVAGEVVGTQRLVVTH